MEHAGAIVLHAGSDMAPEIVTQTLIQCRANCLGGSVAEMLKMVICTSRLPAETRAKIKVIKLYYTSEPIFTAQSNFLKRIFGPVVSTLGWGVLRLGFGRAQSRHDQSD